MSRIPHTALHSMPRRQGAAVAVCLAVATLVAGCGGGDKVKPFQPAQVIAFGDENSAFDDSFTGSTPTPLVTVNGAVLKGSRYTINLVDPTATVYCKTNVNILTAEDCGTVNVVQAPASPVFPVLNDPPVTSPSDFTLPTANFAGDARKQLVFLLQSGTYTDNGTAGTPLYLAQDRYYDCSPNISSYAGNWVQVMASALNPNLSFGGADQCPQDVGNGKSYATWGAKVSDVAAQVYANRAQLRDGVLVTILAGQNDIQEAYEAVTATPPTRSEESAQSLMSQKGTELANIINDIIATGARVVYLTVPDMGKSPKAISDNKSALATKLTYAFNEGYLNAGGLSYGVRKDGHKIVKVEGYTQVQALAASYSGAAACDSTKVRQPDGTALAVSSTKALLLNCTNLTLVAGATLTSHLWADPWHLAPVGHASLGTLAATRVRDQL